MQDVQVRFSSGPLRGQSYDFEVGQVAIGRLPGEGGLELKGADSSVSRSHAELVDNGGDIELRNLSPNGTEVDGKVVLDSVVLKPGAEIKIGSDHSFSVQWKSFAPEAPAWGTELKPRTPKKKGPLSSPVVRAVIGVYLLGLVGVAVWISSFDSGSGVAPDEWPALQAAYEAYDHPSFSEEEKAARTERAKVLVLRLRALRTRERTQDIEALCREIMGLDSNTDSPLYRFGAQCLGSR